MTDEDHDDLDWASARWTPLADENPALADELAHVVVGSFFTAARLDYRRRDEALTQLQLNVGHTPKGVRILQAVLPIGAGEHLYEWDGTAAAARAIAVGAGESAGRTIIVDRAGGSPCGWEPPDLPARRKD
jgi:hypothetical protein